MTDWFGRILYDQFVESADNETCTWTIQPPKDMNAILILKLVAFPVWTGTIASDNYLTFPEGKVDN